MTNVVINSIPLLSQKTGIGRYTYEISKSVKKENKFSLNYYYGYYSKNLVGISDNSNLKSLKSILAKNSFTKKAARKFLLLFSRLFSKNYDLYWEPNFIPIDGIKAKKTITSVHDFSFILYKDFHPKERIEYFENNFFNNIKRSNFIICFSMFTKKEILERLDFDETQVKVIYHGIDHNLFRVRNNLTVSFELPKKFIFSVGTIEPRKNLVGLLKAYNQLSEDIKNKYHLVLAGFQGWNNQKIMDLIESNQRYIHYLGYISDVELVKVYNLASLFVYPSFYEGFGLPVLEAMACGTPVVCSDVTSLPEVGGDAVVYCDPNVVNDIAKKIEIVLSDEKLQQEMTEKGLQRAKQFTWEKAAQKHIRVFHNLLEKEN